MPDPATGAVVLVDTTSAAGSAVVLRPVPAQPTLVGFDFWLWLTLAGTGSCFGLRSSNALEIRRP